MCIKLGKCRTCEEILIWAKPYKQGDLPINQDGTPHICVNQKQSSTKKTYRFEGSRMYGYNPPEGARYGKDRCGACRYNNHPYCDPNDSTGHFANV